MSPENKNKTEATLGAPAARRKRARGFSLLEIMVVLVLIGIVVSLVAVNVMGQLEKGQIKAARTQAMTLGQAVENYRLDFGKYPSSSEGLDVLARPPKGKPIIENLPKDPWDSAYIYTLPGQKNPSKFDIRSKGPDGQENTDDDVGNWPE